MSLPGNRIPDDALPPGGSNTPAEDADVLPVWCRHSIRWSWVAGQGGFVCDDPEHHMDDAAAVTVGAIPHDHQPTYAHPPRDNPAIQAVLDAEDTQARAAAIEDHARRLTRGW